MKKATKGNNHDMTFYLLWYNMIRWSSHIRKKSSFLSFYSFLVKFSEYHRGSIRVKSTKYCKIEWSEKCHYHVIYFLNVPMFNLLFFVILFYIERKWLLMRILVTILPLKSKVSGKFQRFNAIDRSTKMLKNSWIFKNIN